MNVKLGNLIVDFDAAEFLMNDEIRERLHHEISPCSEQEFLDAYIEEHEKRFNEEFDM